MCNFTDMSRSNIYFWQYILSPHIVPLVNSLVDIGYNVNYITCAENSPDRESMGWSTEVSKRIKLEIIRDSNHIEAIVEKAPSHSIHICQGLHGNGVIGFAQSCLRKKGVEQWIISETVDDNGLLGMLRFILYRILVWRVRSTISGVLAIGKYTPQWMIKVGFPDRKVYPFAYFLNSPQLSYPGRERLSEKHDSKFRILFVGKIDKRKNLEFLIDALSSIRFDWQLTIVGNGPLKNKFQIKTNKSIKGNINWIGVIPINQISEVMEASDCLILPSLFDGWGSVIIESLMAGTPVICSDRCGASNIVELSGRGGVYKSGDIEHLKSLILKEISIGRSTDEERASLTKWAECMSAPMGAKYLATILNNRHSRTNRPSPPWYRK
jgi:glycosyltransferase involved in cell wall biosynthesis